MSRFWHLLEDFFPSHPFLNVPMAINLDSQTTQIKMGSELLFNEPTCITWQKNTRQVLNFGQAAYHLLGKTNDQVEVVFPLAKNKVSQSDLLAVFLKSALSKVNQKPNSHFRHADIYLGVMSGLSVSHAQAIKQIFQKISLVASITLIPRVQAVYQSLWQQKKVGLQTGLILFSEAVAEVAVFSEGKMVVANRVALGKDRFLALVREQIRINHQLEIGNETAAQIWQEVAAINQKKDLQMVIRGKHILTHLPTTCQVSSQDLNAGITKAMEDLLQVIRQTFRQVSPELMGGILEKGLTVAGGAGIRGLESYLVEKLHCPILITTNVQNDILNGLLLAAKTRKNA